MISGKLKMKPYKYNSRKQAIVVFLIIFLTTLNLRTFPYNFFNSALKLAFYRAQSKNLQES